MKQMMCFYKKLTIYFVCSILLVACGNVIPSKAPSPDFSDKQECIPPVTTFAFPVKPESSDSQILPGNPWQIETHFPDLPSGARNRSWIWIIRPKGVDEEIWIKRQWRVIGQNNTQLTNDFLIYSVTKKKWRSFFPQIEGKNLSVGELYQTKDNVLWGQNFPASGQPFFSVYNEKTEHFELVNESKGIPNGKVLLDQKGIFWVLASDDFIYSYDPHTKEIKRHIAIPDVGVQSVALASDGSIYILNAAGKEVNTIADEDLLRFHPETDKIERIGVVLEPYPPYWSILMDNSGYLWLADRGWMKPDGTWYQIVRSPIFIRDRVSDLYYRWENPSIIMASSDGRLWFESENGLAWLDPSKGEWCWFTTYQSDIVEDQQHNLWLVADGKLYKYPLKP